jgi:hypothetical protein
MGENDKKPSWLRPSNPNASDHDWHMTQSEYMTVICKRLNWILIVLVVIALRLAFARV